MNIVYEDAHTVLIHGDALDAMNDLHDQGIVVSAVVTDPPYSSGGSMRSDRMQNVVNKYQSSTAKRSLPTFEGDHRDQRGYLAWSHLWMSLARHVTEPGGSMFSFIDWRQLPVLSDAVQSAGWTWQGVGVWDKGHGRPNKGRFSAGHELIVHGINGRRIRHELYAPAVFRQGTPRNKEHLSQKPVEVMEWIMRLVPAGCYILDPFAGSGTTLVAARKAKRLAIGVEADEQHLETIIRRCQAISADA